MGSIMPPRANGLLSADHRAHSAVGGGAEATVLKYADENTVVIMSSADQEETGRMSARTARNTILVN